MTRRRIGQLAVPLFLLACLLLGGSTQGTLRVLALQLLGAALIGWALLRPRRDQVESEGRPLLLMALGWVAIVLLQLIPLPPGLWTMLPGRAAVVEGYMLRGAALPWLPVSLAPSETAATLPTILVPGAILAGILLLGAWRTRWCIAALVAGAMLSVLVGALQLAQGGPYLYPISNQGTASGLFANVNHQGTLLLCTLPFLAALIARAHDQNARSGKRGGSAALSRTMIAVGGMLVVAVGIVLNGSLAALALAAPVALGSLALAWPQGRAAPRGLAVGGLVLLLAGAAAVGLLSDGRGGDSSVTSRQTMIGRSVTMIPDQLPMGSGLGSFERLYRMGEDTAAFEGSLVNHVHSDPIEWLLETGVPGALLLLVFLGWWVRTALRRWRSEPRNPAALAGTVASAAILAHSLVDYPLRDPAIQAVFALALALMAQPRRVAPVRAPARGGSEEVRGPRHLVMTDDGLVSA